MWILAVLGLGAVGLVALEKLTSSPERRAASWKNIETSERARGNAWPPDPKVTPLLHADWVDYQDQLREEAATKAAGGNP